MRRARVAVAGLAVALSLASGAAAGCGGGADGSGESTEATSAPASRAGAEEAGERAGSSAGSPPEPAAERRRPTVEACLRGKGVEFAESVQEIAFLERAEARDDAYGQGYFRDARAGIVINTLGRGKIDGMPPEWFVWIGHPVAAPGEELPTAHEVIESRPPKSFVAYAMRPSPKQRKRIEACFASG